MAMFGGGDPQQPGQAVEHQSVLPVGDADVERCLEPAVRLAPFALAFGNEGGIELCQPDQAAGCIPGRIEHDFQGGRGLVPRLAFDLAEREVEPAQRGAMRTSMLIAEGDRP
ncbi:MAG: hypothetical protein M3457_14590, partial [Chloroflexota bacterium]|nr:hypothetical protein [Chloroflexota bacterium]